MGKNTAARHKNKALTSQRQIGDKWHVT